VLRGSLASALKMPQNQVRVIAPEVGGGFGVKFGTYPEDVVVAALARQRRVPLRWIETRVEHMMTTTHGRGQVTDMEAAVDADGLMIEVHHDPNKALSDGPQSITPDMFAQLVQDLRKIAPVIGRSL